MWSDNCFYLQDPDNFSQNDKLSFELKDDKVSQTDFIDKELLALKEKVKNKIL